MSSNELHFSTARYKIDAFLLNRTYSRAVSFPLTFPFLDFASVKHRIGVLSDPGTTPLWFVRLTHTRLVDLIMDVCGVPQKDSARKACLQVFTRCTAPAPGVLAEFVERPHHQRKRSGSVGQINAPKRVKRADALAHIDAAVESRALPQSAANRLKLFLTAGCSPLPANFIDALDTILLATDKLRVFDAESRVAEPRRLKRYEDIARIVKSLKHLLLSMCTMGIGPLYGSKHESQNGLTSRPLYLALDLGLRQRRKHFHGQLFFQAIVLPDNFFGTTSTETSDQEASQKSVSIVGYGMKVAEGGRYDELVCGIILLPLFKIAFAGA